MKLLAPTLLLVLLLAALVLFFQEEPDAARGPVDATSTGAIEPAGGGALRPAPDGASSLPRERRSEASPAPALKAGEIGWHGLVTVGDGEPVAGVLLSAESGGRQHRAWTGPDGRYRLILPPPPAAAAAARAADLPVLEISPENGLAYGDHAEVAPAQPLARADYVLRRGLAVRVRVLDRDGNRPLAGVPVQGWRQAGPFFAQALSDADGVAVIHVTSFGECWFGIDSAADCLPVEATVWIDREGQEVILRSAALPERIRLQAVDQGSGQPLAGARFSWAEGGAADARWSFAAPPPRGALPSAGGRIDVAAPARPAGVLVEAPGHLAAVAYALGTSDRFEPVPMTALEELPIQVLRGGQPAAARLSWRLEEDWTCVPDELEHGFDRPALDASPWRYQDRTDAQGWAALRWPRGGHAMLSELVVEPEGGVPIHFGDIRRYQMPEAPWTLELGAGTAEVLFRVLDAAGRPVAGAELRAWVGSEGPRDSFDQARRVGLRGGLGQWLTAADGELRVRAPAPGGLGWVCQGRRGRLPEPLAPGEQRLVELRLEAPGDSGASLSGRLWPPSPGWTESLEDLKVLAEPLGALEAETAYDKLDSTGAFAFSGLAPGDYRLTLQDSADTTGPSVVARAGDEGVRIPSPPLHYYLVEARGVDGRLLEEWGVAAFRGGERVRWLSGEPGEPAIEEALLAPYDLLVIEADGHAAAALQPPLRPDQLCRVEVTLEPGRELILSFSEDCPWRQRFQGFRVLPSPGMAAPPVIRSPYWDAAPRGRFRLQPVDAGGEPLGPEVVVPAGAGATEVEVGGAAPR